MAMTSNSETTTTYRLCRFDTLDNGVVEAVFASSSVAAVDQFYVQVEALIMHTPDKGRAMLLINTVKAPTLPIIYTVQQGRNLALRYPDRLFFKTAVIVKSKTGLLIREVNHLIRSLQLSQQRISVFTEYQQNEAIKWLTTHR